MEDLKPCPFCGSKMLTLKGEPHGAKYGWIACANCECEGPPKHPNAKTIKAWNTRTDTDEVKHLKESIQVIGFMLADEKAEVARLREAETANTAMQVALFGADALANVIDEQIKANRLDARSAIGDARLDYGQPWKYEWGNRQLLNSKGPADNT